MIKYKALFVGFCVFFSMAAAANIIKAEKALNDKNYIRAKIELQRSAQLGHPEARFKLAVLHYQGLLGDVDKVRAAAWFYLASEYHYANAQTFFQQTVAELTDAERVEVETLTLALARQFGKSVLDKRFAIINNRAQSDPWVDEPAKLRDVGHYVVKGENSINRFRNTQIMRQAEGDVRKMQQAVNNRIRPSSGITNLVFAVYPDGTLRDIDIIVSYPSGQFDDSALDRLRASTYQPATSGGQAVVEYGRYLPYRVGVVGQGKFRELYPHLYKQKNSLIRRADDGDIHATYLLAEFYRSYNHMMPTSQRKAFAPLLSTAANAGHIRAQLVLAEYQLFEKKAVVKSMMWLRKAAEAGLPEAQYRLGTLFFQPVSPRLNVDIDNAEFWLQQAIDQDYEPAKFKLAQLWTHRDELVMQHAQEVIDLLEQVSVESHQQINYSLMLAQAYRALEQSNTAKAHYQRAKKHAKKRRADINSPYWLRLNTVFDV